MKTEKREKEEKLSELLKEAEDHPLMKQILAEKAAAVLKTRQEAARKIEVLQKERDTIIPKLIADLEAKEGNYNMAKATMEAAAGEYNTARAALWVEGCQFDTDIRTHKAVLYETADPVIDETITFFRDKLDWLRLPGRISRTTGDRNEIYLP